MSTVRSADVHSKKYHTSSAECALRSSFPVARHHASLKRHFSSGSTPAHRFLTAAWLFVTATHVLEHESTLPARHSIWCCRLPMQRTGASSTAPSPSSTSKVSALWWGPSIPSPETCSFIGDPVLAYGPGDTPVLVSPDHMRGQFSGAMALVRGVRPTATAMPPPLIATPVVC